MMGGFELVPRTADWFEDQAQVRRVVDAILDTPLGPLMTHAGIIRLPKAAPTR